MTVEKLSPTLSSEQPPQKTNNTQTLLQDVNNDGAADLVIGAHRADPQGSMSGEAYVVFGSLDWTTTTVDLGNLGTGGLTLQGGVRREYIGYSVSGAGGELCMY